MGDDALIMIWNKTHYNNYLKQLNVNDNLITCKSMKAVSEMIRYATINSLFLNWNNIQAPGFSILCEALEVTDTLKILDLSFNKISKKNINMPDTYPLWLSKMFKVNQSLIHVDLSHNEISLKDGEIIKAGLNDNHILLGLHLTGNEINTNSEGFIVPNTK